MAGLNPAFERLQGNYLFAEVRRRVDAQAQADPSADIISMGIGDVSQPLVPAVLDALRKAVDEMGDAATFRGYGPEQGYAFLREAVVRHDFAPRGVALSPDEIFISDGAKCDIGNIQELFAPGAVVALTDPVYPVYLDSNLMAGRGAGPDGIILLPCVAENNFAPALPGRRPDIIYLCCPNNPTGTALSRDELARWVDYARREEAVILFDAAYEAFISDPAVPHSIYEIPGALDVALEFRSFSKTAGFTGLRCAYAVIPHGVRGRASDGSLRPLHPMWARRQSTKYNGCPYIVQRAAEAVYTPEAQSALADVLAVYRRNAQAIRRTLAGCGLRVFGGEHSPYVWVKTPDGMLSWDFFDMLLRRAGVVCTPGQGFGPSGEGYARFTAFASEEHTARAMERLSSLF